MDIVYVKRFRMEISLSGRDFAPAPPPAHYRFLPWHDSLLDAFARAKYLAFREEIDAELFPCLGDYRGCLRLMREIAERPGFLPEATWLVLGVEPGRPTRPAYCGLVQGSRDRHGFGSIQNLGDAPEHRRAGLGTGLLLRALDGFRRSGAARATLEVTAQNLDAVRLYRRVGFRPVRVVYKSVHPGHPEDRHSCLSS